MADVKGPLDGIRVIDLGRHQAGPRCAQVLARLGAEVIKIERLGGEETRYHGPYVRKQSAYWVQYNSGKKSLSMDLRKEEGKDALRQLIKISDVLLQNFRPGTIDAMGFGYDVLKALNPRIIMVNVSAYGQFGPYRDQIGYDPSGQYPCKDGWVLITGGDQHHWPRVCSALGKPEWLDDPRFTTRRERSKHTAVVQEVVRELLASMTMQEAIAHFTHHDVVAAPVNTIPQAAHDPHPWERRAMVEVPDFLAGTIAVSGDFWHFSRTPAIVGSTPKVGEHNEE